MKKSFIYLMLSAIFIIDCESENSKTESNKSEENQSQSYQDSLASCTPNLSGDSDSTGFANLSPKEKNALMKNLKPIKPNLPIIEILMFDRVLTTELTAPMDVFTKHSEAGKQLFNVITIAENYNAVTSEEGLIMFPDYTFSNAPKLDIIIVPSAYDMNAQVKNKNIVQFIKSQNNNTDYTVSNCAGATLIGESGVADGKKIVTWIGGGKDLQKNYPNLKVQDESKVSYIEDGKFLSSNGNLASYISALELLEKLTNKKHRKFVESYLYLDRLQNWK